MESFKQKAIIFLATGGWIGFSPVAPGTFGSLAALPICLLISWMRIGPALIVVVALIVFSTWIAHAAEKLEAQKDPSQVVLDEICGMAVALFALPFTPFFILGGFALFRVFDILKPFPIRWVDKKVPGGLGIMLDDIIAGIFANGVIRLGIYLFIVPIHKWLFCPISALRAKFYPRNINYMPPVKFFARLDLDQNPSFLDGHSSNKKGLPPF